MSCQPCGCDPEAKPLHKGESGWVCSYHRMEKQLRNGEEIIVENVTSSIMKDQLRTDGYVAPKSTESQTWTAPLGIKDSGQRVTYTSGSMRDPSTGKIKWSRITFGPMMRRWAQHLTNAEIKYPDPKPGVPNFTLIETEEEYIRYKESALRHFMSWFHEETDEDHASAVFFNINGVEIIKDKRRAK